LDKTSIIFAKVKDFAEESSASFVTAVREELAILK